MRNSRDSTKTLTMVGAAFFLLLAAALSFSLYGEALSKTKSAVLMACVTVSASVLSIGRYLQSAHAKSNRHDKEVHKKTMDS